jgi:hypothetical protein
MMFGGLPMGMADFLARKYDIMQQQANAGMIAARSAANLDNVKAGLLPAESRALIEKQAAERGLTQAETYRTNETAAQIAPLANAEIGYKKSAQNLNYKQGYNLDSETALRNQSGKMMQIDLGGMSGLDAIMRNRSLLGGYGL